MSYRSQANLRLSFVEIVGEVEVASNPREVNVQVVFNHVAYKLLEIVILQGVESRDFCSSNPKEFANIIFLKIRTVLSLLRL